MTERRLPNDALAVVAEPLMFDVASPGADAVDALWCCPPDAFAALVLAHGAGAGMHHPTLATIADSLAVLGVATLRFQFPFMQAGRKRADPPAVAIAALAAAFAAARARRPHPGLPLFLGGHSFGGRMASHAALPNGPCADAAGLVMLAFPLHPAGKPGRMRAAHLPELRLPMLFVSGSRDALAEPSLLAELRRDLPAASWHLLHDADHAYHARQRERGGQVWSRQEQQLPGAADADRSDAGRGSVMPPVLSELADVVAAWLHRRVGARS